MKDQGLPSIIPMTPRPRGDWSQSSIQLFFVEDCSRSRDSVLHPLQVTSSNSGCCCWCCCCCWCWVTTEAIKALKPRVDGWRVSHSWCMCVVVRGNIGLLLLARLINRQHWVRLSWRMACMRDKARRGSNGMHAGQSQEGFEWNACKTKPGGVRRIFGNTGLLRECDEKTLMTHDLTFQIGAGLYAVGRPVQKKERRGRPNRHQSIPAPRERGLIQPFFR